MPGVSATPGVFGALLAATALVGSASVGPVMAGQPSRARKVQARRHRSEIVALPASGNFRVVMISDTHGQAHPKSAQLVRAQEPNLLLHGGDIGDPQVLERFEAIAPLFVVRGNIDARNPNLCDSIDLSFERGGQSVLRILLMHIAVYGAKLRAEARRLAQDYRCSLVVCGHSHVPFIGKDRGISMINPGSIGPRRFNLPIVFGVLDISEGRLSAHHVSCETGETWLP